MSWKFWIIFSTATSCCMVTTESANILVVVARPAPSHFKSFQPLWEALIERGHNVTIIAGFKLSRKVQSKYTLVDVKPLFDKMKFSLAEIRTLNYIRALKYYSDISQGYIEEVLKFPAVQTLINSNDEYDLVIVEMFYQDAFFAFGYKFNAPVIAVSTIPVFSNQNWILANPFPASYCPDPLLPFTEKMSLPARIMNMAYHFVSVLFYEFVDLPRSQIQIENYFNFTKENVPHIKDIMKNISVTLINSHHSLEYVKPDLPNIVNIAGIHLTPPTTLPENIQKFMDEAEYGVIYWSLGSRVEPDQVENLGKIFIRIAENLPQRVVMKWDANLLPYVPKHFLVQKWIPQADVLKLTYLPCRINNYCFDTIEDHPKCRLFITHGGWHSLLEGLNASVPFVGIPFFGDQQYNMKKVEYFEIGVALNIDDISEELLPKINEVLYNPKYKENIMKRSQLFRERLNTPMDTAIYWVDHVLKHKGTSHLRPASTQLTWYEFYSVDVLIAVAAVIIWGVIKVTGFVIPRIMQKLTWYLKRVLSSKTESLLNEKLTNNLKSD